MIPVRLKMRNFMCYRDNVPALDFTGIHLACLSGDNGNGKSAIIDAMTWAVWGKARADSDDDLIHAAQNEMEVEFEFNVGEQLYRIIRKRTRPKKRAAAGQSSLEFQVKSEDGFRPITGNTIAQTQQKIIEVLHMDYDTFVNSAYLRQGHADEFTRQAPAKRKEVLGSILGLDVYDALEERAKELAKKHEADTQLLESAVRDIDAELARKPDFAAELAQAQTALAEIDRTAQEKEAVLNALRQQKESLESRQAQLEELEKRLVSGANDLRRWEEQAGQHLARLRQYEEVIGRRGDIESGYATFAEIKKSVEDLERKAMQSRALEKQREQVERRIDQSRNELLTSHAVILNSIQELEKKAQTLPALKTQLGQAQERANGFRAAEEALKQKQQSAREIQSAGSRLEAENARMEREIGEAEEKLDLIAGHLGSHAEARCPLCEQELTREGLELIRSKYDLERQDKANLLMKNREVLAGKRAEYAAAQKEIAALEETLNQEKTKARGQEEYVKTKIKEIEEGNAKLADLKAEAGQVEERLAGGDFAVNEQQGLAAIEKELGGLGYDAARHEQALQHLKLNETYERDKNRLDEALRLYEQEKEAAAKAQTNAQMLQASLQQDTAKKVSLAAAVTTLPRVRQELAAAEAEYKVAAGRRAQAQEAVGSVRARLERLNELETRKKESEDRRALAAKEEAVYRELAKAFGKAGIQALIIEAALPEIETEADRLLARLTDGRMHVKFETQRETKKGTVQETLDIAIADELGTRNYEMFSGGEAFRINFAVRIALSRLLAGRAGAPLPTLIIDEGFGTQDSTGMEKLKEAINSIQGDFEKILVVTHMDELKDAFPTRIDVTKTADGSTINVN
ncbi:MAG: SMC family ATPase [Dehalococcoidales bacterium]|jgi:exonuclease SbcC